MFKNVNFVFSITKKAKHLQIFLRITLKILKESKIKKRK